MEKTKKRMKYLERKAKAFERQKQQWSDEEKRRWISEMERIDAQNRIMAEITLATLSPAQAEFREMFQQAATQEGVGERARRMFSK